MIMRIFTKLNLLIKVTSNFFILLLFYLLLFPLSRGGLSRVVPKILGFEMILSVVSYQRKNMIYYEKSQVNTIQNSNLYH